MLDRRLKGIKGLQFLTKSGLEGISGQECITYLNIYDPARKDSERYQFGRSAAGAPGCQIELASRAVWARHDSAQLQKEGRAP
jgi:hypothetical protein